MILKPRGFSYRVQFCGPTGADAGDIYVSNNCSGNVSVINSSTDTVIDTITVGNGPEGVAVSPTGPDAGDIYVANFGGGTGDSVSVINPSTDTVIATVTVGDSPIGVAVSPTGPEAGDIYVTNFTLSNNVSVIEP